MKDQKHQTDRRRRPVAREVHRSSTVARWGAALTPVVAAMIAPAASATDHYWQTINANWNVAADWNTLQAGGGVTGAPVNGDNAYVLFNDALSRTLTYVNPGFAGGFNIVTFDNTSTGNSTLSQAQDVLSASNETFGNNGSGALILSAGTNNTGFLTIGNNVGSKGSVTLSGTGVLNVGTVASLTASVYLGQSGAGAFTQNGGIFNLNANTAANFYMGANASGNATYNLQAGTLNASSIADQEIIGGQGTATFNQSGGTHLASLVYIGAQPVSGIVPAGVGTYNMSAGNFTSQTEILGYGGIGTFNQTNGAHVLTGSLYIADQSGTNVGTLGTYNLAGGSLATGGSAYVGYQGVGTVNQSGGSNFASGGLYIGYASATAGGPAGVGVYNMTGGTLTSTAVEEVGYGGTGTFNQSNGAHIVQANLYIGFLNTGTNGNSGAYNESGGSLTSAGIEYIGYNGIGIFNQRGGTHSPNGLIVGDNVTAVGTYSLSNGATLSVNAIEVVGYLGKGSFLQTGGTHAVNGNGGAASGLTLGSSAGAAGTFNLQGGTLQVNNGATFVGYSGSGNFTQSGGTHTTQLLQVGFGIGSTGTYTLSAGNLTAGSEQIAVNGAGTFTQSGGFHSVGGDLTLGQSAGFGTYNLQGGSLNVPATWYIADQASSQVNQSGGTATLGGLQMAVNSPASQMQYAQSAGSLNVTSYEYLGVNGNANFTQTGGVHTVGSGLYMGFSATSVGYYALGNGATLSAAGFEEIGYLGNGQVFQSGGANSAAQIYLGGAYGGVGRYDFYGANASLSVLGTFSIGDSAAFGTNAAGRGTFNLSSGTVSGGSEVVGYSGIGTVNQAGGTETATNLSLGYNSGAIGVYNFQLGSLTVTNSEIIGNSGSGTFIQNGGLHAVTGALVIAQNYGSSGSYTLNGGGLNAQLTNNGAFTFNGGEFDGLFVNNASLNVNGAGSFNGLLVNNAAGTFNLNTRIAMPGGVTNAGAIYIPNAAALYADVGPFDNEGGTVYLSGGLLSGSVSLINNGVIAGFGAIGGYGPFLNNGLLNQGAGNLVLSRFSGTTNNGAINLASGRQLQLSAPLQNAATINLNGAFITGTGGITNSSGGQIVGPGTITTPLGSNQGMLISQSGALNITQPFANAGAIQLGGLTASVIGGAVTNSGTVQGFGTVNNPINNTGTVEAIGGTLALGGAVTNGPTGVLRAATGNKLLVTGVLAPNLGAISLTGGTVDTNGHPLVNNNTISGFGTLATGGLTNAPGAQTTFSGGLTTVNGAVDNASGGTIRVSYNPAIFTHPVTNSGTFKITATTVTFAAPFTNNGLYTSDPATTHYTDLTIGKAGALAGGVGDKFFVSGDLHNSSSQPSRWDTADGAELHFDTGSNPAHAVTLTGIDLGPNAAGYHNNFAWGIVALDAGQSLNLSDGDTTPGGALYTTVLQLAGAPTDGTLPAFIANHLVNASAATPLDIYYDAAQPANAYLGGATYALGNGGVLAAVPGVPEPTAVGAIFATAAMFGRRKRRR